MERLNPSKEETGIAECALHLYQARVTIIGTSSMGLLHRSCGFTHHDDWTQRQRDAPLSSSLPSWGIVSHALLRWMLLPPVRGEPTTRASARASEGWADDSSGHRFTQRRPAAAQQQRGSTATHTAAEEATQQGEQADPGPGSWADLGPILGRLETKTGLTPLHSICNFCIIRVHYKDQGRGGNRE